LDEFERVIIKARKRKTNDNIAKTTMMNKKYLKTGEIPCNNRFEALTDKVDDVDMSECSTDEENLECEQDSNKTKNTKTRRPPPLVIHGKIQTHMEFMKALKEVIKENFHVKYHEDFTKVFTSNLEQHSKLKRIWQLRKINFHTYTDKTDKRRNLCHQGST